MVFFVGSSSFENDVAGEAVLDGETELRFVEDVFLGSEVDFYGAWQELLLILILGHRWLDKAFRDLAQRL